MEVHRIVLTVIDFDGLGAQRCADAIANARFPNHCISPSILGVETRNIGEWRDDHPLNRLGTAGAEITRLFAQPSNQQQDEAAV